MKHFFSRLSLFLASIFFTVCVMAETVSAKPKLVATFSVIGDLVQVIAGDKVELHVLVGPNSDGHVYQPTAADARAVSQADLLIANGLGFEVWLNALTKAAQFKGKQRILGAEVEPLMVDDPHGAAEIPDPHAWQDIQNVMLYVAAITAELIAFDPAHRQFYTENSEKYTEQLRALHKKIKQFTESLPAQKRKLVTSHDAFGYFGKAYGLEFIAPQGMSTDSEAKTQDVARLIQQIRADKIPALFMENMLDARLLTQISRETGVVIGGTLFSDALSEKHQAAPDYLSMMEHNLSVLQRSLQ